MGRPKGWKMSDEHKQKLAEGRRKAREEKLAQGLSVRGANKHSRKSKFESMNGLPVMYITGKEKNSFDFVTAIRNTFRLRHDYLSSPKIIREICDKDSWKNTDWIKRTLSQYVYLKIAGKD